MFFFSSNFGKFLTKRNHKATLGGPYHIQSPTMCIHWLTMFDCGDYSFVFNYFSRELIIVFAINNKLLIFLSIEGFCMKWTIVLTCWRVRQKATKWLTRIILSLDGNMTNNCYCGCKGTVLRIKMGCGYPIHVWCILRKAAHYVIHWLCITVAILILFFLKVFAIIN